MTANAKPCILYKTVLDDGSLTASSTETDFDVANVLDLRPFTWWRADTEAGDHYITSMGAESLAFDSIAVIGHNLKDCGGTISVESSTGSSWVERLAGYTPGDNKAFFRTFPSTTDINRRIKITTTLSSSPPLKPQIAVCILGSRMDFERYLTGEFDPCAESLNAIATRSKNGNMIGAVIQNVGIEIAAKWNMLTPNWVENTFRPAWDAHLSWLNPFFFIWDYVNHPQDVYFVTLPSNFKLSMPYNPFRRTLSLTMEGIKEIT
jgi:hypothetical protein